MVDDNDLENDDAYTGTADESNVDTVDQSDLDTGSGADLDVTDDDIGASVFDTDTGDELGTIEGYYDNAVTVSSAADLDDDTRTTMGWDNLGTEYTVDRDALETAPADVDADYGTNTADYDYNQYDYSDYEE